ncbi:hypothetical protein [Mucilaginibacter puniceus]
MTSKYRNYLGWAIKLIIIILTAIFLYTKLSDNKNLGNFLLTIRQLNQSTVILTIILLTALMATNWVSEAYKWMIMICYVEPISLWNSFHTIICGLTVGILTPNRIGEYSTRIMFLSPRKRLIGVIIIGVGAFAQLIAVTLMAGIAIPIFIYYYKPEYITWNYIIISTSIIYCTILISAYFNIKYVDLLINKIHFLKKYRRLFTVLSTYKKTFLLRILCICFGRLFILIIQYYLLIHLLISSITFSQVMLMIAVMIAFQTVIPTIDILDVGVRGATAAYLFGFITDNDVAIVASTTAIWFINLIVPAIIGLVMIARLPQDNKANWLKV